MNLCVLSKRESFSSRCKDIGFSCNFLKLEEKLEEK